METGVDVTRLGVNKEVYIEYIIFLYLPGVLHSPLPCHFVCCICYYVIVTKTLYCLANLSERDSTVVNIELRISSSRTLWRKSHRSRELEEDE